MTLSDHQALFTRNLTRLLNWIATTRPMTKFVLAWVYRSEAEQSRLVNNGISNAKHSLHCQKLAADIYLFDGPEVIWDWQAYEWIGRAAEHMGMAWGGRWKNRDGVHFQHAGVKKIKV